MKRRQIQGKLENFIDGENEIGSWTILKKEEETIKSKDV